MVKKGQDLIVYAAGHWKEVDDMQQTTDKQERQWLFDVSLKNIRAQGKPSMAEGIGCAYRGGEKGELRCGAAPFIVDFDPEFEGKSFRHIARKYPDAVDPRAVKHETFVRQLQYIHDGCALDEESDDSFLELYEDRMEAFAWSQGLEYKELSVNREV